MKKVSFNKALSEVKFFGGIVNGGRSFEDVELLDETELAYRLAIPNLGIDWYPKSQISMWQNRLFIYEWLCQQKNISGLKTSHVEWKNQNIYIWIRTRYTLQGPNGDVVKLISERKNDF